jgi:hypothetical protein
VKPDRRVVANWVVVVVLTLLASGAVVMGIVQGQVGQNLFNATLV